MWYVCNNRGGGIDNTQTVNLEGIKSLDAVQNNPDYPDSLRQGLNIANGQIDNLFKMIRATGTLTGDVDWNNYIDPGVYKVQNAVMTVENHAPVGLNPWGILVVYVSEIIGSKRTIHTYYPDNGNANAVMAVRMHNSGWRSWFAIAGTQLG